MLAASGLLQRLEPETERRRPTLMRPMLTTFIFCCVVALAACSEASVASQDAAATPHDAPTRVHSQTSAEAEARDAALASEQNANPPRDVVGEAVWWPSQADAVSPDTQTLEVMVLELECASGMTAEGRIKPPTIEWGADSVTVTYRVAPVEGGATCQGHPSTPERLDLGKPLGDRRLLDGGSNPPRQPVPCRFAYECRGETG